MSSARSAKKKTSPTSRSTKKGASTKKVGTKVVKPSALKKTAAKTATTKRALNKSAATKKATSKIKSASAPAAHAELVEMCQQLAQVVETHSLTELIVDTTDINLVLRRGDGSVATVPSMTHSIASPDHA